jgi:hypothetical protein
MRLKTSGPRCQAHFQIVCLPEISLDLVFEEMHNSLQRFPGSINLENMSAALNGFELRISGTSTKGSIYYLESPRAIFTLEHQH